jgi:hypothetical protein
MKEFLQRLQRSGVPEGNIEVDNEVIIHKTNGPLDIAQGQIKNDKGISLAIYRLPNDIEEQVIKQTRQRLIFWLHACMCTINKSHPAKNVRAQFN